MIKYFCILLGVLMLVSCTSNTIIKKPDNLISKNKMVDLLTDMHIANAGENIKNIHLQRAVNYYPLVFAKYNIDSTQFKESNYYYTSRIDDYDEILARVEARLTALKEQYDLERKISDSINRGSKPRILRGEDVEME